MSQLSTMALARASDAREIAEMSRDLIEEGLTWSWTPARVQHFIMGAESSVVVARRAARRGAPPPAALALNPFRHRSSALHTHAGFARASPARAPPARSRL